MVTCCLLRSKMTSEEHEECNAQTCRRVEEKDPKPILKLPAPGSWVCSVRPELRERVSGVQDSRRARPRRLWARVEVSHYFLARADSRRE